MGSSPIVPTKPSIAHLLLWTVFALFVLLAPLSLALARPPPFLSLAFSTLSLVPSAFAPCSALVLFGVLFVAIYRDAPRSSPSPPPSAQFSATFPSSSYTLTGKNRNFAFVILSLVQESLLLSRLVDDFKNHQPAKRAKAYARTKKYRAPTQKGFHTHRPHLRAPATTGHRRGEGGARCPDDRQGRLLCRLRAHPPRDFLRPAPPKDLQGDPDLEHGGKACRHPHRHQRAGARGHDRRHRRTELYHRALLARRLIGPHRAARQDSQTEVPCPSAHLLRQRHRDKSL